MEASSESAAITGKETCPCDDPSQSFVLYDDGHGYCFAGRCPHPFWSPERLAGKPEKPKAQRTPMSEELKQALAAGTHKRLAKWGITQATCRALDYRVLINSHGEGEHWAIYKDEHGQPLAAKVRNVGKDGAAKEFRWEGPGQHVYGLESLGKGGLMLVITAGEKDRLTISQLWGNKFPVISPANGAKAAPKDIAHHLERLSKFDKIVICMDMDEPGRNAALEIARLFKPGKAFIAKLPFKDANEMHLAGEDKELISAIHNAAPFRPDGIVDADEIDDQLLIPPEWGARPGPHEFLYKWTYGMLGGQVWVFGAGTGVGKSDYVAEIVAHHIKPPEDGGNGQPCAVFNYEAGAVRTLRLIVGKQASRRFTIPPPEDGTPSFYWSPDELEAARTYRREKCAKLFINDHKGAIDWDSVKERIRYLRHSAGITLAVVDPVAALVSGEDDERRALDRLFAESKELAEELGVTIIFVSHLARPKDGKGHEEGGRVELRHMRGSGAIVMWASFVLAFERNQQGDKEEQEITTIRMLKDRETGDSTGNTQSLQFNQITGRVDVVDHSALDPEAPPPPASDA